MSQPSEPPGKSPVEAMREARTMMLTTSAADFGIEPSKASPRVYNVVMDWPLADLTITVVARSDGNASLYTTSGFGVIGGGEHKSVRAAATQFVTLAEAHHDDAMPTKDWPYPTRGLVRFYLVCFDGVRVIEREEALLESGNDTCSDLWKEGQRVMAELRLLTQKSGKVV